MVAAALVMLPRRVARRAVQHLINQRVAVGRTANHIVMLRTDKFRRHVDGQRRGVRGAVGIGQV